MLPQIRFTLIETSHPGNIGAAARAMRCMDFSDMVLVAPKFFPHPDALSRASGAEHVLNQARVYADLKPALGDSVFVVGTTARERSIGWPVLEPRPAAARIMARSKEGPVSILFGRESSGLTNTEVDMCQLLVRIPTGRHYTSLNLASAVQIMAYELFLCLGHNTETSTPQAVPADYASLDRFYRHLEQTLHDIDFIKSGNPPTKLMRKLTWMFNRMQPSSEEISILRGILTAAQSKREG